ncbi:MAG: PEP-utilizing enzyme [Candidatus Micrarchaeota archaeon]
MGWKMVAEEYNCSPLIHVTSYQVAATSGIAPFLGENDTGWMFAFDKSRFSMCWFGVFENFEAQAKKTLAKMEDPEFVKTLDKGQRDSAKELYDYSFFVKHEDFSKYSNSRLYGTFEKLFDLYVRINVFGHVINLSDFETNLLSNKLTKMLEEKINISHSSVSVAEAFSTLTTPAEKSFLQKQDEDFYVLMKNVQEKPELKTQLFQNHVEKYDWLQFGYDGPTILDENYFQGILESELKQGVDASEKLAELNLNVQELEKKQNALSAALGLTEKESYWLATARNFVFLKGLRKDVVFLGHRCAENLFSEIGNRLGLSVKQVKQFTRKELKEALETGYADKGLLSERMENLAMVVQNGVEIIYVGTKAEELAAGIESNKPPAEGVNELKGTPACPGFVRGVIKFVARNEDMAKMNEGDVLIAPATNPNLVPAMRKAGAIVTDEGGITCHAAIVSRELGIPCIVGTKIVTKAFKDGDLVEVDANKGIIRKVDVE